MYDAPIYCPECGEEVWDTPRSKLAKCWNTEEHASGGTLAFDTMSGDDEEDDGAERARLASAIRASVER